MTNKIIAMGIAHPDSLCLFGWDDGGVRAIDLAMNTNRFKAMIVCSGYKTAFPRLFTIPDLPQRTNSVLKWSEIQQSVENNPSFRIKGFNTPIQMVVTVLDSSTRTDVISFESLLAQKGCLTDMVILPEPQPFDVVTRTDSIHETVVAWFEKSLRGKHNSNTTSK